MTQKIRIDAQEHLRHPLRVHSLLSDFELEDVWRPPLTLDSTQPLQLFTDMFSAGSGNLAGKGLSGKLFRFRLFLGKLLKWDQRPAQDRLVPGSIRFRYAQEENLQYADLPDPGSGSFIPVYQLENESLYEIENHTVHAALHFSRVPSGPDKWDIHMAVYVKPKGLLGRCYMLLIKPFRLWIVYPAIMKGARQRWEEYLRSPSTFNQENPRPAT